MTQIEAIRNYIRDFGSITPFEAFADLGITKLATRISEMIVLGYPIVKEKKTVKNRYGRAVTYMQYSFKDVPRIETKWFTGVSRDA